MPFIINCAECKRKLRIQDHLLGKNIKCPGCGVKLLAKPAEPAAPTEAAAPAPAASAPVPTSAAGPLATAIQEPAQSPSEMAAARPTTIVPQPLSSPSNEEPLEVLDPIVLEEPSTDARGNAATTTAPPPEELEDTPPRPLPPLRPRRSSSPLRVFALLTGLLLVTIVLGLVMGWRINQSIENVRHKTPISR